VKSLVILKVLEVRQLIVAGHTPRLLVLLGTRIVSRPSRYNVAFIVRGTVRFDVAFVMLVTVRFDVALLILVIVRFDGNAFVVRATVRHLTTLSKKSPSPAVPNCAATTCDGSEVMYWARPLSPNMTFSAVPPVIVSLPNPPKMSIGNVEDPALITSLPARVFRTKKPLTPA
jgi:hypothetical protein